MDCGCDFFTTQMFFDNKIFYSFCERLHKEGVSVPIIPGIMPITSYSQLNKMVLLSGNELPKSFLNIVSKYDNDPISFKQAGIEFAIGQAKNIYDQGFKAVHVYSMNKPDVARIIKTNLKEYLE